MYKIMIVDDEPIEREALKLLIKNHFDDLTLAGEAQNGFEAIEMSNRLRPDLMIIDIKMPGLSGIDAIKEIKKNNPLVKFLILSSYDEFEYAQQALRLGAEDFIVKPAKMQVMTDAIRAVIAKLENEQSKRKDESLLQKKVEGIKPHLENDLVAAIISGCGGAELQQLQEFLGIHWRSVFCIAVAARHHGAFMFARIKNALAETGVMSIGAMISDVAVLFVPYEKEDQEQYAADIARYLKKRLDWDGAYKLLIGSGNHYPDFKGFRHSYLEALEALQAAKTLQLAFAHIGKVAGNGLRHQINIGSWEKRFFEEILSGDPETVVRFTDDFLNQMAVACADNLAIMKDTVHKVMVLLDQRFAEMFGSVKLGYGLATILEEINELSDLKGIRYWIISRLQKYIATMNDTKNTVNVNAIVRGAVDYIRREFANNITLDDVAKKLNISPFYLSKILKKHTGKNYTDMVVEMRIMNAKELLEKGEFSIKEVTYLSGFNSQNYFAKIFRKIVGVTPTEYRNLYYEKRKKGEKEP